VNADELENEKWLKDALLDEDKFSYMYFGLLRSAKLVSLDEHNLAV
jgi:hypothetical protein